MESEEEDRGNYLIFGDCNGVWALCTGEGSIMVD
jgi:hypothetical protein